MLKPVEKMMNKVATEAKKALTVEAHSDPDVISFHHIAFVAIIASLLSLVTAFALWSSASRIFFAFPAFPKMIGCEALENYFSEESTQIPPIIQPYLDTGQSYNEGLIKQECQYKFELFQLYSQAKNKVVEVVGIPIASQLSQQSPYPNFSLMRISVEAFVKVLSAASCFFGFFGFYALSKFKKYQSDKEKTAYHEAYIKKFWTLDMFVLNCLLTVLVFFAVDIIWFFINRSQSQALAYNPSTSILFTSLLIGVFSFLHLSWLTKLNISDLSLFTSLVILLGLIGGMLATNHIWNIGPTNAYSTMSARVFDEHLTYEVLGEYGSRNLFRLTFFATGLLFILYIFKLYKFVRAIKNTTSQKQAKNALDPMALLVIGGLTGVLMLGIGFFPVDSLDIWKAFPSGDFHKVCAYVSPLFILYMVSTFWYLAYPKDNNVENFLRSFSMICTSVLAIAMMMFITGNAKLDPKLETIANFGIFILLLGLILFDADRRLRKTFDDDTKAKGKHNWFFIWLFVVGIGMVLGYFFPDKMTTVSVEFVILIVFSLFLYALSKYLVEYSEDRFLPLPLAENQGSNMAIAGEEATKLTA